MSYQVAAEYVDHPGQALDMMTHRVELLEERNKQLSDTAAANHQHRIEMRDALYAILRRLPDDELLMLATSGNELARQYVSRELAWRRVFLFTNRNTQPYA